MQLERTQDRFRAHLQCANKHGATGHDEKCNQQNERAQGWRHQACQTDRAGRRSWIQLDGDLGGGPFKTTEMGSLDAGRQ